jgi:hypothetical protein
LKKLVEFVTFLLLAPCTAIAAKGDNVQWRIELDFHTSAQIAGASEQRAGYGGSVFVSRSARFLAIRGRHDIEARELLGLRFIHSIPQERRALPFTAAWISVGGEFIGRGRSFHNFSLEAGTGIFVTKDLTFDLSSKFDFGTYFGAGYYFGDGPNAPKIAIRFCHISNAGLRRPNFGVNLVEYALSFKI